MITMAFAAPGTAAVKRVQKSGQKTVYPEGEHIPEKYRGEKLPTIPKSVRSVWERLQYRIHQNLETRVLSKPHNIISSELLGKFKHVDLEVKPVPKGKAKPKAGFIARDLRKLHYNLSERRAAVVELRKHAESMEKHGEMRLRLFRKWKQSLDSKRRAELDHIHDVRRDTSKAIRDSYDPETRVKLPSSPYTDDQLSQMRVKLARVSTYIKQFNKTNKKPVIGIVAGKTSHALAKYAFKVSGKSDRNFLINRVSAGIIDFSTQTQALADQVRTMGILPTDLRHRYFRQDYPAVTAARHYYEESKEDKPDIHKRRSEFGEKARETVEALEKHGDLAKWRTVRDYLQMYDRITQPGTRAHMYMSAAMPYV